MTKKKQCRPVCRAVVAIPACNEAVAIRACLAALITQRMPDGAPLPEGSVGVLVYANNCTDDTAAVVREMAGFSPFEIRALEERLPPDRSHAGTARLRAMDAAAEWLEKVSAGGALLTTDADSVVCATWVARTLELLESADAVAGYIEAKPEELVSLGPAFLQRGRLEDRYLARVAEIYSLCDPLPHDPWPNHRVTSGASLAVSLSCYRAIGGLPPRPVGEDAALVEVLTDAGYRVRHAQDVTVATSCRLQGRATGGAADTMRARHEEPDAPCDAEIEPAFRLFRRALWKGALRSWFEGERRLSLRWERRLNVTRGLLMSEALQRRTFEPFWRSIEAASPRLQRSDPLRPSQLPAQIEIAERWIERSKTLKATAGVAMPVKGAAIRLSPVPEARLAAMIPEGRSLSGRPLSGEAHDLPLSPSEARSPLPRASLERVSQRRAGAVPPQK